MKLSIIIPAYNEEGTIAEILKRISGLSLNIEKEIIVIDDGSTDKTGEILKELKNNFDFVLLVHELNQGKGAAIRTGIEAASGNAILIQDADLEYDPNDYEKIIEPFFNHKAKVVYGSRNLKKNKMSSPVFYWGGKSLTLYFNLLFRTRLTDINTCYKLFGAEILKKEIILKENRFNFCEEVSAKVVKRGYDIIEIPINYYPRKKNQGKKICWKDGVAGFWAITKYRF